MKLQLHEIWYANQVETRMDQTIRWRDIFIHDSSNNYGKSKHFGGVGTKIIVCEEFMYQPNQMRYLSKTLLPI